VQELDPLSAAVHLHLSELYYYWHKPDNSIEQANMMLAEHPDDSTAIGLIARAYAQKSDFAAAFAAMENLPANNGDRAMVLASAGRRNEARKIIDSIMVTEKVNISPYYIGCLYAAVGDRETAFAWLEKSYAVRQADLVSMKVDPALDSLRDDPRYIELLGRVHLND
jgi:predicted Zn-dependent protease